MEFGKLSKAELKEAELHLPPDTSFTNNTLEAADHRKKLSPYIGCAKWGRKEWLGKLYSDKTKEANFLDEYVNHFNSIELNATFYQIYNSKQISKWAEKAGDKNFKFCPKISRGISHYGKLTEKDSLLNDYFEGITAFGEHLGPIFLQLSDRFSPKRLDELKQFLLSLPKDLQFFVEVRHPDWYADKKLREDYFGFLKDHNIGAVITDAAGRRDCVHMMLPIPKAFIRFVGNNLDDSDFSRMDEWIKRLKKWKEEGLEEVYFFMHQPDEKYSPEAIAYLVKQLNEKCKLSLEPVKLQEKSPPNK